jgi:hypothetical protein
MAWLARKLGCSRQMLYGVLAGSERSALIEQRLGEMFPELPEWPPSSQGERVEVTGAVELTEWLAGRGRR